MKERPIIFNADMVRAVLDGRKTQTRRIMKVQPVLNGDFYQVYGAGWRKEIRSVTALLGHSLSNKCPFGAVGDRLWVRETFRVFDSSVECACEDHCSCSCHHGKAIYRANGDDQEAKWTPSIHMPRWASRITLEITGVRVERLHAITLGDICKEFGCGLYDFRPATYGFQVWEELWRSIYGADSWQANPWVWVIEFKRVEVDS